MINFKNFIAYVETFDVKDTEQVNPLKRYFLTKTSSIYEVTIDGLVLRKSSTIHNDLGITGKDIIKQLDDNMSCCFIVEHDGNFYEVVSDSSIFQEMLLKYM